MADDRRPILLLGLGLAGIAGAQLLQRPKPAPPAPTCPAGYHLVGNLCVQDSIPPPPAPPPATGYRVTATAGLIVRTGPGTNYPSRGVLAYGTVVTIACQTTGQRVINSSIWDQLSGPISGYVSDWYVSTPVTGGYSPGLAICAGAPPAPPVPVPPGGLPPTGKAALNSLSQIVARMLISLDCTGHQGDYVVLARRSTATSTPPFGRVWIKDQYTWEGLGAPRSARNIVTPGLLAQIRDAGTLRRTIIRNYGEAWVWDANDGSLWDTAMQGVNRGPFSVLKLPAGWC